MYWFPRRSPTTSSTTRPCVEPKVNTESYWSRSSKPGAGDPTGVCAAANAGRIARVATTRTRDHARIAEPSSLLIPQREHRVHARGAPCRQPGSQERHPQERCDHTREDQRVARTHAEQE